MLQRGIVGLTRLYALVAGDAEASALNGRSRAGRAYGKLVGEITASIATQRGFYLWGAYGPNGLWRNIYLGKAGFRKAANLRARIAEELRDERAVLWSGTVPDDVLTGLFVKYYPQYQRGLPRKLRKRGSTHIIWVAVPTLAEALVEQVEADLIEGLNPSANLKRPKPPHSLQDVTREVFGAMRLTIHEGRSAKHGSPHPAEGPA